MLRRLSLKAWIGIGAGAATVIGAIIAIVVISNSPEAYRTIKVFDLIGSAKVVRNEDKVIDAYTNMRLESNDNVTTDKESYMQLKLDNDKYVLLEPETEISLKATGSEKDSKTRIYLKKGAIVNDLENELSSSSEYKIETPNSTIAVRGTTFRVEVKIDENGETYTVVSVYEGTVVCNLIYPDGTVDSRDVEVTGGQGVQILGTDATSMYIGIGDDVTYDKVTYDQLELEVLEFLKVCLDKGKDLSITEEELQEIIDAIKGVEESSDNEDEDTTKESDEEKTTEGNAEEETTSAINEEETTTGTTEEETTTAKIENETTKNSTTQLTTSNTTSSEETTTKSSTQQTTTQQTTTQQTTTQQTTTQQTTTQQETTTEEQTTEKKYTVTFMYNGKVFTTQEVKEGELAIRPTAKPASVGDWQYDFSEPVTSDITVEWNDAV